MEVVVAVILVCADKIVVPAIVMNIYTTLTHCKIEYVHQFCVANKIEIVFSLMLAKFRELSSIDA